VSPALDLSVLNGKRTTLATLKNVAGFNFSRTWTFSAIFKVTRQTVSKRNVDFNLGIVTLPQSNAPTFNVVDGKWKITIACQCNPFRHD
jgi:hypothetical protein